MDWKPPFADLTPKPRAETPAPIGEVEDAYDLLRRAYQSTDLPLATRIKCANVAVEYERPRFAVIGHMPVGGDFADRLERAVARSRLARAEGEPFTIDAVALPPADPSPPREHPESELLSRLHRRA